MKLLSGYDGTIKGRQRRKSVECPKRRRYVFAVAKNPRKTKEVDIRIRCDKAYKEFVQQIADEHEFGNVSNLVRRAITEYIARRKSAAQISSGLVEAAQQKASGS
jgi:Arc/MetJ-type ribon-helix-helix transcriptional regulator